MSTPTATLTPIFDPNFSKPNPLLPTIEATTLLCSVLITFFTVARLVAKRLKSKHDTEDYLLMVAWAACLAFNFTLFAAGWAGLGYHVQDIPLTHWPQLARFAWALEIAYTPPIWLAKASLIFQLKRIFAPHRSGHIYWACHILIWGNLVFYVTVLLLCIFECHPIHEVWNFYYQGHCINRNIFVVVSGAINVFSDLLNLLLPIWAIWHLQMALKRKAGISAIFAVGLLAFISSICRLVYATYLLTRTDISYSVTQTALWGAAEVNSIVLCTCFPMMPRFAKLIWERYSHIKDYASRHTFKGDPIANARKARQQSRGRGLDEDAAKLQHSYEQFDKSQGVEGKQTDREIGDSIEDIEMGTLNHSEHDLKKAMTF